MLFAAPAGKLEARAVHHVSEGRLVMVSIRGFRCRRLLWLSPFAETAQMDSVTDQTATE
jgi:hypothetical protein